MWATVKHLALGFFLIGLTSSVLLVSDWHRRQPAARSIPRVAILQNASVTVIDDGVAGMLDGLAESGFTDGENIVITRYNAEHDMPTLNAIAKEITAGQFDLVLTASTPALQAVANANQAGKSAHVFGIVSDPFAAGVGISRDDPLDHPKQLTGIGSFVSVEDAFRLAKTLFPHLTSVGEVWNPAEANSEGCTVAARDISRELGIRLVEANADNSSAVLEAASSLAARRVQALWVGCDSTVLVAVDSILKVARESGIPVFTSVTGNAERGALFDVGINFYEVGKLTGALAGQILHGTDPATVPVKNVVPARTAINTQAVRGLRDPWRVSEEVLRSADVVIDETGRHEQVVTARRALPAGRVFKVGVVYFGPDPAVESGLQGFLDGLRDLGFVQGENLEVRTAHAYGEIATIPQILQNYTSQDLDLIVPLTTPCLTAACSLVKEKPVVFTVVYDPLAAGAGTTRTAHLPNVTGVGSFPPLADTIDLIQQLVPKVQSVGTLYNSSEANSRKVMSVARKLFAERGLLLEEIAITNSSEVFQAAQVLATRNIQAFWITGDNTALQAFEGIVKVAEESRLPLIINDPEFTERGALASSGLGWYQSGYAAAKLAAEVLLGENPQNLPIEEVAVKTVALNFKVARKLGITFPPAVLREADVFVDLAARHGRPERIAFIQDEAGDGKRREVLLKGLAEIGLVRDTDFILNLYMTNGESENLFSTISAIQSEGADVVLVDEEAIRREAAGVIQDKPVLTLPRVDSGIEAAESPVSDWSKRAALAVAKVLAGLSPGSLDWQRGTPPKE